MLQLSSEPGIGGGHSVDWTLLLPSAVLEEALQKFPVHKQSLNSWRFIWPLRREEYLVGIKKQELSLGEPRSFKLEEDRRDECGIRGR